MSRGTRFERAVDLFATTELAWCNCLVCRTGNAENNVRIALAAKEKGLMWHPYKHGFTDQRGKWLVVKSEEDVYRIVGLPYLEPWERN